jgi:hypothetical protein
MIVLLIEGGSIFKFILCFLFLEDASFTILFEGVRSEVNSHDAITSYLMGI